MFTTLPPGVGLEGGGEVLGLFTGVGSMFSSPYALEGRVQGVVKGGFVSRSSLCSSLVDGGGCWLTELSMAGEVVRRKWTIEADLEGSMRSISLPFARL